MIYKKILNILLCSSLYLLSNLVYAQGSSHMIYADNKLMLVSSDNYIWYSNDGITWSQGNIHTNSSHNIGQLDFNSVAFGNGVFIATAPAINEGIAETFSTIWYSTDGGANWYEGNGGGNPDNSYDPDVLSITPDKVSYGNNTFILLGNGGVPWYSIDGINWHSGVRNGGTDDGIGLSVAFDGKNNIAVVRSIVSGYNQWENAYSDDDGDSWSGNTINGSATFTDVTYGYNTTIRKGKFVAVGTEATIWYSSDGKSWTVANGLDGEAVFNKVVYDKKFNMFLAIADEATIAYSYDGENWSLANIEGSSWFDLETIAVSDNGTAVVSGDGAGYPVMYSRDGINWNASNHIGSSDSLVWDPITQKFYSAETGDGAYENIFSSSDGSTWYNISSVTTGW